MHRAATGQRKLKLGVVCQAICSWMQWFFLGIAIALFVTWIVFRVVLAIPLGVLNMLWMMAILFVVLGGVHRLEN